MAQLVIHWWTYEPRIRLVYEQQVVYEARIFKARTKLVRLSSYTYTSLVVFKARTAKLV